ncbi:MAG: RNA polymerase sigma factor, partial [Candidatus Acidiferrales bacterium]
MQQDAQLVQQCLRGDTPAWEELVRRHTRRIYNLCYRFTSNRQEAEDMTQEVFLRVYKTLGSYRAVHGGFTTWMTSVTRNLLIDHYRRTKRDRLTDSLDDEESGHTEQIPSQFRTPDQMAMAGQLGEQVQRALGKLSPDLREAVILRDLQGLEYREIQDVLQVPEGTVKSRINRGRIELARLLEQMGV